MPIDQVDVCRRYLEGYSIREVAREFGVSLQRIHQILVKHSVERRPAHDIKNSAKHRLNQIAYEDRILREALAIQARRKVS